MRVIRVPAALSVAALAIAGAVVAVAVTGSRADFDDVAILLVVTAYAVVGIAVELARPAHQVGRLMLGGAALWGAGEGALAVSLDGLASDPDSSMLVLVGVLGTAMRGLGWLLLIVGLPLVFPDGKPSSERAKWLVIATVVAFTAGTLLSPVPLEERLEEFDNPIGVPDTVRLLADLPALGGLVLAAVALFVAIRALVRRYREGAELLRQQVLVFVAAFAVPLLVLPLTATPVARPWMFALSVLPVPVAVAVAMFQRRLYDVQLAVSRTITYLALSVALAGVYALVVGGVGVMLRDSGAAWLPWAAAGVVAVAFAPLRESLQGAVNRLTYGRWSAPAEVLADTGRRLADSADSRVLLTSLTAELVQGLALTYAEIRDATGRTLAEAGTPSDVPTDRLSLTAFGRDVGELRWSGRQLRPSDRSLLVDLCHQIGGAVHTAGLVEALSQAQERLVLAREQERKRLRSDLHDGLGPSLAGLGFQLDAVHNLIDTGEPVEEPLAGLRAGLAETVTEVRRIVEGLRPPAIDDLGLFGAVGALGRDLAEGSGLELALDLPEQRVTLPAAVEVAAYRVAQEALTNVVRHAGASSCRVSGSVEDGSLVLEVRDDGRGGAVSGRGLGIPGMRQRAREIGGRVEVSSLDPGTAVTVRLPVHAGAAT